MKRRQVEIEVSDHAVLRWPERSQGLDVEAVRDLIAGKVLDGAQLQPIAVCVDRVRFMLRDRADTLPGQVPAVVVSTVLPPRRVARLQRPIEAGDA